MAFHVPVSGVPILQDPPFAIGLVWLGTATGYRVLRVLRAPLSDVSALERGVLSAAVGLGLLQFPVFALGMAGLLNPIAVKLTLLGLVLLFARDMGVVARGVWRALCRRPQPWLPAWAVMVVLLLTLPFAMALLLAVCPPVDPDGLGYHLTAPKRWLQTGSMRYLPTLVHTNASMGVEMLYASAMAVWSDTAAKLVHYSFGVLSLAAVIALGRRLRNGVLGVAAALLLLVSQPRMPLVDTFSTAYVDMAIVCETVCAVLAWMLWRRSGARGWLICSGLCAGLGASFKLTGICLGVVLAGMLCAQEIQKGMPARRALARAGLFLGLSLVPVMPWLLRSWVQTGDPVYPMLSGVFHPRDWGPAAGAAFTQWFRYFNWANGARAGMSLATRQLVLVCAIVVVAVAAGLTAWRWRDDDGRTLLAIVTPMALAALVTTGLYPRFFLPLVPLVSLMVCLPFAARLRDARLAYVGLVGLAVLGVWQYAHTMSFAPAALTAATGRVGRDAFLNRSIAWMPVWRYANTRVPPDERLLVTGFQPVFGGLTGGASYYCDLECFMTDPYLQGRIRMDTWDHYLADLSRDRIHYMVMPTLPGVGRCYGPDYAPARNELPFAARLARQGIQLCASGGIGLYRIEPTDLATGAVAENGRHAVMEQSPTRH